MANSYKILGQIAPTANALTNVYVTGASSSAVINSIYICNQSTANANVSIVVRPIDESIGNQHYVLKDQVVLQAESLILNLNITMDENVILAANNAVRAGESAEVSSNVSISAFGVEIS